MKPKKFKKQNTPKKETKIRYNIVITIVYIVGIILLLRLFELQIVKGEEYREQSNTRLTRETKLKAARGNLLDSSGNKLVSTKIIHNVEIHKTKIDTNTLNNTLLIFAKTLEENQDKYIDTFPIKIEPYQIKENVDFEKWKTTHKIDSTYNEEQCFNYYRKRYDIDEEKTIDEARKIITLRYALEENGYSNTKSLKLASNISNASFAKINEMSSSFPGIDTYSEPTVAYPYGEIASHILGYILVCYYSFN